jgi:hypothetical protein
VARRAEAAVDEYVVDFPTLFVGTDWVEAHCVVPDGFHRGDPLALGDWQLWCLLNHYRVRPDAEWRPDNPMRATAFHNRRSQIVAPQKAGKAPVTAGQVCLEGVGPALFAGWARGSERYDCRDWGCGCGWVYEYEPGEPMGMPWPTPLIQITAFSEEQSGNIYDALKPMIDLGPLAELIPKTGEEFIRLPGGGRIDVVTSSAKSRLGQRVTFVPQDETGLWTERNGMVGVAETQRRGLAGMGGRASETTNAWDPSENSVAQRTAQSRRPDIFRFHRVPAANLSYRNKKERRQIHRYVYAGSPWVDLEGIEAEAAELLETDPEQAERFFGNRNVRGKGGYMPEDVWERTEAAPRISDGAPVAGGFDGSETDDWTAIRLETRAGHRFTPTYGPDRRPTMWNPAEWGGRIPRGEVRAAVSEVFRRYRVARFYPDPREWHTEIEEWAAEHGEQVVVPWATYRVVQMHAALERALTDLVTERSTHDSCPIASEHVLNARKLAKPGERYILGKPSQHQKIDACMADVLAHEAAADARAAGWPDDEGASNLIYLA